MSRLDRSFLIVGIDVHKSDISDEECGGVGVVCVVNRHSKSHGTGSLMLFFCRKCQDCAGANGMMEANFVEGNCHKAALWLSDACSNPRAFIHPSQHATAKQVTVLIEIGG